MPTQNEFAPEADGLVVQVRSVDGRATVCTLAGDLDIETLAPARQALEEAVRHGRPVLVVDLGQVEFCDSSGLNLLLKTRMAAIGEGIELRLAAATPPVQRLLELTGANTVFSVHRTLDAALTAPN